MAASQTRPSILEQEVAAAAESMPTSLSSPKQTAGPPATSTVEEGSQHENDEKTDTQYLTGLKLITVVVAVSLVCFLVLLDTSILSTATPYITSQFHSLPDVGWYAGAYQLCNAALQPITGKFYSHFRIKYTFLIFMFIFELGSLLCGIANSSTMLIIGRSVAGLGSAGLMSGGLTILSVAAPLNKRPLYTGIAIGIAQVGLICGPLIGGALTEYTTWRWCFYINIPLGAIIAAAILPLPIPDINVLKEKFGYALVRKTIPELDLIGFCIFAPAAIMFLLALQYGSDHKYAWSSATIIGLFVGSGVTALIFIAWENHRGPRAMLPGHVLKQRVVYAALFNSSCLYIMLIATSYFLPIYFQAVKGASPTMSGVYLLPSILGMLFTSVACGVILSKTGYYLPWAIAGGVVVSIGTGLLSTFRPHTSTARWIGFQIIVGVGRGLGMQIPYTALQAWLPTNLIPTGIAMLIFFNNFATSVGIVLATTVFSETLKSNLARLAPQLEIGPVLAAGGGAKAVRQLVPGGGKMLDALLESYSESVGDVFYMCAGISVLAFVASWGMGWRDVRKEKSTKKEETTSTEVEKEKIAADEGSAQGEEAV